MSLLIQWIATLFGGLVIAFASSWKVSLLVLAFVPSLPSVDLVLPKRLSSLSSHIMLSSDPVD